MTRSPWRTQAHHFAAMWCACAPLVTPYKTCGQCRSSCEAVIRTATLCDDRTLHYSAPRKNADLRTDRPTWVDLSQIDKCATSSAKAARPLEKSSAQPRAAMIAICIHHAPRTNADLGTDRRTLTAATARWTGFGGAAFVMRHAPEFQQL